MPGPIDSGGKSRLFNLLKVTSQEADIHYLWLNESPSRNIENFSDFDYCQKEFYKTKFKAGVSVGLVTLNRARATNKTIKPTAKFY